MGDDILNVENIMKSWQINHAIQIILGTWMNSTDRLFSFQVPHWMKRNIIMIALPTKKLIGSIYPG
jgi:hypothetical protein